MLHLYLLEKYFQYHKNPLKYHAVILGPCHPPLISTWQQVKAGSRYRRHGAELNPQITKSNHCSGCFKGGSITLVKNKLFGPTDPLSVTFSACFVCMPQPPNTHCRLHVASCFALRVSKNTYNFFVLGIYAKRHWAILIDACLLKPKDVKHQHGEAPRDNVLGTGLRKCLCFPLEHITYTMKTNKNGFSVSGAHL